MSIPDCDNLSFRPMKTDDYSQWIPFFENQSCAKFYNFTGTPEQQAKNWVNSNISLAPLGQFAIILNKIIIGSAGIVPQKLDNNHYFEVGYAILPTFQHLGYATKAAIHIYNHFNHLYPISIIRTDNLKSINTAIRANLQILKYASWNGFNVVIFTKF